MTLTRRDVVIGVGSAWVARLVGRRVAARALVPQPSQPATPVGFDVPPGACDCHTHIFGEPRRFPFVATRTYTPEAASIEELRALHRALHIDRVVIVQPSVYGVDNACLLDALRQIGPSARGVAVIDDTTPDAALDEMSRAGVRGLRVNLATGGQEDAVAGRRRLTAALDRANARNWHVQIFTGASFIERIHDDVRASPVPVVFDHFGGAEAALGIHQPGFDLLLALMGTGHAYVKISAPYRSSTQAPPYADVGALAQALIAANPERVLWGTDWPHPDSSQAAARKPTDIAPLLRIDDGGVLNQLAIWAPDAVQRRRILVENPARLYEF